MIVKNLLDEARYRAWLYEQDPNAACGTTRSFEDDPFCRYARSWHNTVVEVLDDDESLRVAGQWVAMPGWLADLVVALDGRYPRPTEVFPQDVLEMLNGMERDNT